MPTMTNLVVLLVIYNINILGNILFYIRYISSREQNPHDRRRALAISDGDFLSLLLKQCLNCRMGVVGQETERLLDNRKQVQNRSRKPVFVPLWSCIHVQAGCFIRISKLLLIATSTSKENLAMYKTRGGGSFGSSQYCT